MADEVTYDKWDRIAWLCLHMPRFGNERVSLEDFHPLRRRDKQVSINDFDRAMEEVKDLLPEKMSEEEIERQWKERKVCRQAQET